MAWNWRYGWIFKTNPMKKVMICLTGCFLLAVTTLRAQVNPSPAMDSTRPVTDTAIRIPDAAITPKDTSAISSRDTTIQVRDSTVQVKDTVISLADDAPTTKDKTTPTDKTTPADNNAPKVTVTIHDGSAPTPKDSTATAKTDAAPKTDVVPKSKDTATAADDKQETARQLDTRWFISPLLKVQFQDFAMLEKNREGYLSNANTLPFFQRGNGSFAASAYKNITSRLSVSGDLGLSFGHVTNNNVEISQTKSKTYNLLNVALFYHLLPASYRLQPYVTVGVNDIINDASYVSIPVGIGAKFNSRKVMVLAQVMYGASAGKNISNTTMYSMGIYIPIKNKKSKQLDNDDNKPYNRPGKDDAKNKDTTGGRGGVVVNVNVTINMDSVLRSKGLLNDDGSGGGKGNGGGDDDDNNDGNGRSGHGKRRRPGLHNFDVDDFENSDFKMDSLDGRPVIRFVVYFEFNEYGLTTKGFNNIDRVINHLKKTPNEFTVEIKGYTDSVGSDPFNNWLSRKRAKMVLDYMNSRGVPTELMKAKAYGRDNPVGDNSDPNQAWLNRRAEIIVHAKESVATDK
jgi:outer membrane protein OmpA-like peptidoglycan-associated protein